MDPHKTRQCRLVPSAVTDVVGRDPNPFRPAAILGPLVPSS